MLLIKIDNYILNLDDISYCIESEYAIIIFLRGGQVFRILINEKRDPLKMGGVKIMISKEHLEKLKKYIIKNCYFVKEENFKKDQVSNKILIGECPKCGHLGVVDSSTHVKFKEGIPTYRCRKCSHVWTERIHQIKCGYDIIEIECCRTCKYHGKNNWNYGICEHPKIDFVNKGYMYVSLLGKCDLYEKLDDLEKIEKEGKKVDL